MLVIDYVRMEVTVVGSSWVVVAGGVIWMLVYFHLSRITVIQIHGYSVQQSAPYYPI